MADGKTAPKAPSTGTGTGARVPRAPAPAQGRSGVMSAARMQPLPAVRRGPLGYRIKNAVIEHALNLASILRDIGRDFRRSDRFFKYKAFILAGWLTLSGISIVVACPGSGGPQNTLGARLVQAKVAGTPVMMIVNDSGHPWKDVTVIVNNRYRAAVGAVSAEVPDNNLTLEPRKLLGEGGRPAPESLVIRDLVVKTDDGKADLLVDGQQP